MKHTLDSCCTSSLPGFTPHNRSYTTFLLKRHRDAAQDVFAFENPQHPQALADEYHSLHSLFKIPSHSTHDTKEYLS